MNLERIRQPLENATQRNTAGKAKHTAEEHVAITPELNQIFMSFEILRHRKDAIERMRGVSGEAGATCQSGVRVLENELVE